MNNVILGFTAVAALATAGSAAAQRGYQTQDGGYQQNDRYQQNNGYQNNPYGQNGYEANGSLSARIDELRIRIETGVQSGAISRAEAQPLRQQLRALMQLERQYSYNGLSGQERVDLQARLRNLRQQIRAADGGAQGRYDDERGQGDNGRYSDDQYGNGRYETDRYSNGQYRNDQNSNDRYGNGRSDDGRYGRVDRNGDGYDDRQDDPGYEQPAQRGGLGGIIDRVIGGGSLRVGQRASGNLYALPSDYRGQYRDSGDAYFRTDGRQIYQIDARTQTVVRVYPMR